MTRLLIGLGLVAAVAAVIFALALEVRAARGRAEAAEARVAGYAEAARIHAGNVARLEAGRKDAAALDRHLQEGEGANAPLSDYLRRGAGRVWP